MKRILMLATLIGSSLFSIMIQAQPQERGGGGNLPPSQTVWGKVTSAGKDSLVVAPLSGGDAVTVKIGENTRLTKDRQPAKLTDIKTNDVVFVRGQLNGNAMTAAVVGVLNPQMVQRMQQSSGFDMGSGAGGGGGFGGGAGGGGFNREDLGKKFIAGEVKTINETKLTIARPDGQSQEIEVDENTSFKRGHESITLPDIQVGDFVRGPGELKNNVFIPKELAVGRPRRIRMDEPGNAPQQSPPAGNSSGDKASTPAPPEK